MPKKICVIGEGSWGTAVSTLIAQNGFEVIIWCHDPQNVKSINEKHINEYYFPNHKLDTKIKATLEFQEVFENVEWIFEAIPVKYLRNVLNNAKAYYKQNQKWVVLSKGIENDTLFFPSQIIDDVFCTQVQKVVLSGPSFAYDLINKDLTAVNIAGQDNLINELKSIIENQYFKVVISEDPIGIQVIGALKNVVAIILGYCDAKNYSENTKAYIFTKCIEEINTLINYFGGKKETILSLAGIGDLTLTCFGSHSKNLKLGYEIGIQENLKIINENFGTLPEGFNTVKSIYTLSLKENLNLPLFKTIYQIIFEKYSFDFVKSLED